MSRDLRERYLPDPPSFVYQKMYQTIIFRGIGGICYRKCHHMTRCTRQNRDGTCADWFCRKVPPPDVMTGCLDDVVHLADVWPRALDADSISPPSHISLLLLQVEGCHNYPGDYHVPSLEECGVNGLCKPGKCYRSFANRVTGDSLPEAPLDSEARKRSHQTSTPFSPFTSCPLMAFLPTALIALQDDVTDPNACPARTIPSLTGCCPSGVISSDGACCPTGSSVDKDGACCPSENLDACGMGHPYHAETIIYNHNHHHNRINMTMTMITTIAPITITITA